jgi:histidine triad (HIT) family protein
VTDCIFCKIASHDVAADVVHEDNDIIMIVPLNPVVPGHILAIPKTHVKDALENPLVTANTLYKALKLAVAALDADDHDYNIITSVGEAATQTIFHLHWHLVPRVKGDGLHLPWTGQMEKS